MAAMDRPASLMTPMARDILFAKKQKRQNHKKATTCSGTDDKSKSAFASKRRYFWRAQLRPRHTAVRTSQSKTQIKRVARSVTSVDTKRRYSPGYCLRRAATNRKQPTTYDTTTTYTTSVTMRNNAPPDPTHPRDDGTDVRRGHDILSFKKSKGVAKTGRGRAGGRVGRRQGGWVVAQRKITGCAPKDKPKAGKASKRQNTD